MKLPPVITSKSNERVKALRASLNGKACRAGELLGLEGPNLIREAHHAGCSFETVFLREDRVHGAAMDAADRLPPLTALRTGSFAVLDTEVFESAVSTECPQGIAATWIIREPGMQATRSTGTVLVLEDVRDPGNLGTLIRSAAAFGATEVCLTPMCANQWNPKVVRASAGAAFRMPVRRAPLSELIAGLRTGGARVFAAVSGFVGEHVFQASHGALFGRQLNIEAHVAHRGSDGAKIGPPQGYAASLSYDSDFVQPCAVMVGNEGRGLSDDALALADERVQIPCSVESLNAAVAGSVLLYEAMRQIPLRAWAHKQGLRP